MSMTESLNEADNSNKRKFTVKNIIYKEIHLVISPVVLVFALISCLFLMTPTLSAIGVSYGLLSLLSIFNLARANKDHDFTASLPLPRSAIVLAKHITVVLIEALQLGISGLFALIRNLFLFPEGNASGLDPNAALFGIILIGYSVFNLIFLPAYFKTGYKTSIPFFIGIICCVIVVFTGDIFVTVVPALNAALDNLRPESLPYQLPVLFAGLVLFVLGIRLSCAISVKNFSRVNL
ncbi:hypothetical protein FACS1894151_04450 [Spirochaetia bacterium]|nr:hypothetical protein FACS1894151_04450 [Spirochaetia bacterium]